MLYNAIMTNASRTIDISKLVDIQTKLRTAPIANHPHLDGIFYRGQDFSRAHAHLNETFFNEFRQAGIAFPESKNADELHSALAGPIEVYSSGKDHFTTRNLSPALRHFINDSCRLLEPFTVLFGQEFRDVQLGKHESLNSYLKKLQTHNKVLSFDADFILDLYEVWNDYKHRSTSGVHVTAWRYANNKILKPTLILPTGLPVSGLRGIEVDEFQNQTSSKILDLLNFVT